MRSKIAARGLSSGNTLTGTNGGVGQKQNPADVASERRWDPRLADGPTDGERTDGRRRSDYDETPNKKRRPDVHDEPVPTL